MQACKTICHLSFNHSAFDDRIYWKELLTLKRNGYNVVHIAVAEQEAEFTTNEGIRIITIKRKKKLNNVYLNRLIQFLFPKGNTIEEVYQKAASISADAYHYHDLQLNALTKKLKNLPHQPKVIYDAHEAYHLLLLEQKPKNLIQKKFFTIYNNLIKQWELKQAAFCNQLIVTDQYTFNYFRKRLPLIPSTIIYNFSFFQPNSHNHRKKYHCIYTGLLNRSRGIDEMIKAISFVKQEHSSINLLLIGRFDDESYKQEVLIKIKAEGLENTVFIKEEVPFNSIASYYQQSCLGLGIFHNTPKYNTFIPIKLFEYMAFGIPVIFSDHGPSAKIIADSQCGLLVDYKNPYSIADAIKKLLSDSVMYNKFSVNGKNAVQLNYNWLLEEKKLLALYSKLFNMKHD